MKQAKARHNKLWDYLAWVAFAIVFVYLLLKLLGVIHSPLSIDLLALVSGTYFIGRYAKRIDDMFRCVSNMRDDFRVIDKECRLFRKAGTKTR